MGSGAVWLLAWQAEELAQGLWLEGLMPSWH